MEKVSFYSEGCKMIGFLRIPDAVDRKIPGIVCCHGFAGYWDVDTIMQDIAERLSEGGYATLVFYHRGLGESEGQKGVLFLSNRLRIYETRLLICKLDRK